MAKLKVVKNMIDKNTGLSYREGALMTVADPKRIKELVDAVLQLKSNKSRKKNQINYGERNLAFYYVQKLMTKNCGIVIRT